MAVLPQDCGCEPGRDAVRRQVERIVTSGAFQQSQRRSRFLEFIVEETLAGRGDRLKAYAIGREVFDRAESFDPNIDPIVRVEAGRVRDKLREYYDGEGQNDPIRIDLPKGSYVPLIEARQVAAEAPPHVALAPARISSRWQTGATVLSLAVMLAGGLLWMWPSRPAAPLQKSSIAVLPFKNIGNDPVWDRFADGMTEDIITDLAHSKDLFIIARNTAESYKGRPADVRTVGRELGVRYVLEGSIQPNGEQIRVTAQLINAETGGHVWSARYDRPAAALFDVQGEVTGKIATTLIVAEGAVAEAERNLLRRKPPANMTAFDTYLLAMEAKHKVTKESLAEAERLFNKAIELDPHLARAYYGLATVQMYLIDLGLAPSIDEALAKMLAAAHKSVELDPDDGNSHLALGGAYGYAGKVEQATAELNKAEILSPSDADLLLVIAWSLCTFGETERALALVERSLKLNPHYADWYNQGLAIVYFLGEKYENAAKYASLIKEPLAPDYAYLAMAKAYIGRADSAKAAAASVVKLDPAWNAERYLGERGGYPERQAEVFVEGARRAGLPACLSMGALKDMPNFVRVKSCDAQRGGGAG
jgi:TolB-like protein